MKRIPRKQHSTIGSSPRAGRPNHKRQRAYKKFIHSIEWQEIRSAKLKSVNGICENCPPNDKHGASEVHHLNYTRFGGNELTTDLRALCPDCHKRTHKSSKRLTGMWLSIRVAAEHAQTQFGVDIRDSLIASYSHA